MEIICEPLKVDPLAFRYSITTNNHGKDYKNSFERHNGHPTNNNKDPSPSSAQNESIKVGKTLRVFQKKRNVEELKNLRKPVGQRVKLELDDFLHHNAPKIKKSYRSALLKMLKKKQREIVLPYRNEKRVRYVWNKLQHNERQLFKKYTC
jgi:hypothetical protein